MWAFLSRLPVIATLVTFTCVVIMFALGLWQLQRAEQKTERLASIDIASKSESVGLQDVLNSNLDNMLDISIVVSGQNDSVNYFLLDNKIHQGRVGYQVLVPVHTVSGTLITNYGWVGATNSRDILPSVQIDGLKSHFAGVVSLPSKNAIVSETAIVDGLWPKVIQQIDLDVISQHYEQQVLPFVVLLAPDENENFVRNWQPVVMPPEKHIAYAIQWFLLALAALAVFVYAHRNKLKRNSSE